MYENHLISDPNQLVYFQGSSYLKERTLYQNEKLQFQYLLHLFLNLKKTEFTAVTLICCPIILLQSEKKTSFLELNIVSDGDLYLLIKDAMTLSFLDKYFLAAFQYLGVLLMPSNRHTFLESHFSFKYYE